MLDAKTALLQALIEDEGFGLELIERVRERTGGMIRLGQGTIYPALRDLERDGLVKTRVGEPLPERGGRPRIYYRLTGEGRSAALEERRAILSLLGAVDLVPA